MRDIKTMYVTVHHGNTYHSSIEIISGECITIEPLPLISIVKLLPVNAFHPLRCINQKPCCTTSRINNLFPQLWNHKLNQQIDNMLRCAKLAIDFRSRKFRQHVFIQITSNIPVFDVKVVNQLHGFLQG